MGILNEVIQNIEEGLIAERIKLRNQEQGKVKQEDASVDIVLRQREIEDSLLFLRMIPNMKPQLQVPQEFLKQVELERQGRMMKCRDYQAKLEQEIREGEAMEQDVGFIEGVTAAHRMFQEIFFGPITPKREEVSPPDKLKDE